MRQMEQTHLSPCFSMKSSETPLDVSFIFKMLVSLLKFPKERKNECFLRKLGNHVPVLLIYLCAQKK